MPSFEKFPTPEINKPKPHPFLHGESFHPKKEQLHSPAETESIDDKYSRPFYTRKHGTRNFTETGIAKYKIVEPKTEDFETEISDSETSKFDHLPKGEHQAPDFGRNPILRISKEAHEKSETQHETEKTRRDLEKLLQSGDLENITTFILEKKENIVFEQEIERVKNEYSAELSPASFLMKKDWRILTALELFDKGTFKHSIRTYVIAREVLENGPVRLGKEIEQEGVILKQFYTACFFHDLGKFAIPKFILNSTVTDEVWTNIFMEELSHEEQDEIFINNVPPLPVPDEIRNNHEKLHEYFKKHDFRAVSFVPVCKAFNKPEELEAFEERGINSNLPLMKIIEPHEKHSKMMLKKLGYGLEAILAGHHHNYDSSNDQEFESPTSSSALQVINELSSDAIHTIDVLEAFSGGRSYFSEFSWTKKYHTVIHLAQIGRIKNKWVAASIINDRLKNSQEEFTRQEAKGLEEIKKFLDENLPEEETSYFE